MMNLNKKITCLLIVAVAILLLASCGKEADDTEATYVVYGMRVIEIPEDIKAVDIVLTDSTAVILDKLDIIEIEYDGTVGDKVPLSASLPEMEYLTCLDMDLDGNYIALSIRISEAGDAIEELRVLRFGRDGTLLGDTALRGDGNFSKSLFALGDGRVASSSWGMGGDILTIRIFDPSAEDFGEHRITVQGSPSDCIVAGGVKMAEGECHGYPYR